MKVVSRVFFVDEQDKKFFGEGPARLLKQVEKTGSLHSAAIEIGMAYSKAIRLLKNAEKSLGFPLTVRKIGGKSGGGSVLTEEAKDFLSRYEAYRKECFDNNEQLFEKYFGENKGKAADFGCVIMASGLGKRFGGDKLTARLLDKPLVQYIVETVQGMFAYTVVVTRNEKVKMWCEERSLPVIFHDLPGRNDTIRLGLTEIEAKCGESLKGCIFCPADMPFIDSDSLRNMLAAVQKKNDAIVRMAYKGKSGAPVLFGKEYFSALKKLPKGKGGSVLTKEHGDKIILVEAKEEYELWDVDTQEDFEKVKNKIIEINEKS